MNNPPGRGLEGILFDYLRRRIMVRPIPKRPVMALMAHIIILFLASVTCAVVARCGKDAVIAVTLSFCCQVW